MYVAPTVWLIADALPSANPHLRQTRKLSDIRRIVVHIDDQFRPDHYNPTARYFHQANYHIQRDWSNDKWRYQPGFGLMYHYKLSYNNGVARVWRTQPETLVTWHASSWNADGVALCIDSSAAQAPEAAILAELHRWLEWMCFHRPDIPAGRADVYGHTEEPSTTKSCPALYLPYVQKFRRGEW